MCVSVAVVVAETVILCHIFIVTLKIVILVVVVLKPFIVTGLVSVSLKIMLVSLLVCILVISLGFLESLILVGIFLRIVSLAPTKFILLTILVLVFPIGLRGAVTPSLSRVHQPFFSPRWHPRVSLKRVESANFDQFR